jgi:phosphatidylglycerol:prolipoprotein diacylglycerol transferase
MALPYVELPRTPGIPFYGLILLTGMVVGGAVIARLGKRFGVASGDAVLFAVVLGGGSFVAAHVFDVAWYQWDAAMARPQLWIQMTNGHSLFGALAISALLTWFWARARRLDLAAHADLAAMGILVTMLFGRVACALVHDHPGRQTDLPIGVDFPADRTFVGDPAFALEGTVRLHDLGLYELVLLLPLFAVACWLWRRELRPGLLAVILAIAYAGLRFPLDFLRHPSTEPTRAGMTAGQWGSIVLLLFAILALTRRTSPAATAAGPRAANRDAAPD